MLARPLTELTLTMVPRPRERVPGSTACTMRSGHHVGGQAGRQLARAHSSGPRPAVPALLTRTSTGPASATQAATEASSVTSTASRRAAGTSASCAGSRAVGHDLAAAAVEHPGGRRPDAAARPGDQHPHGADSTDRPGRSRPARSIGRGAGGEGGRRSVRSPFRPPGDGTQREVDPFLPGQLGPGRHPLGYRAKSRSRWATGSVISTLKEAARPIRSDTG